MTLSSSINRWGERGRQGLAQLTLWTMAVIVVLMVVDVTGRKFFDRPLMGAVELVEQLLMISVYAAIPLVSLARGHINIELFDAIVPKSLRRARQSLGEVFCGLLMLGAAWLAGQHALETRANGDTTTLLRITLWPLELLVACMLLADGLCHLALSLTASQGEHA